MGNVLREITDYKGSKASSWRKRNNELIQLEIHLQNGNSLSKAAKLSNISYHHAKNLCRALDGLNQSDN